MFYGLCFRYLYHDIHAGFGEIQAYRIFLDAVWTFESSKMVIQLNQYGKSLCYSTLLRMTAFANYFIPH